MGGGVGGGVGVKGVVGSGTTDFMVHVVSWFMW